jgi:O-antigen ligase/tetratricopeptide (TPR) repeat protein
LDAPALEPPRSAVRAFLDAQVELLLVGLIGFAPFAFGIVQPWSEAVALTIGAALALCIGLRIAVHGEPLPRTWAWAPIAAFLALAAFQLASLPAGVLGIVSPGTQAFRSSLLRDLPDAGRLLSGGSVSLYREASVHDLRIVLLASVVFAAVLVGVRTIADARRLLLWVTLIGTAVAALALAEDLTHARGIYWRIPIGHTPYSGPFVNHSHYSQFMNLCMGCGLALLLGGMTQEPGKRRLAWWTLPLLLMGGITIPLSMSRGGMISIVVAGACLVATLMVWRETRTLAVVVLIIGALAGGGVAYLGLERVSKSLSEAAASGAYSGRWQMVKDALRVWQRFPVLGAGLGTHEYVFPAFERAVQPAVATHVENEYAQVLEEMGVLGFACVIAFLGIVWWNWARAVRSTQSGTRGMAAGLAYALVAVMVHSFSDYGQHFPANGCLSAVVCALLVVLGRGDQKVLATSQWRRGVGVLAAIAIWMSISAWTAWRADDAMQRADALAGELKAQSWRGDTYQFDRVLMDAQSAVNLAPGNVVYRHHLTNYRYRAAEAPHRNGDQVKLTPEVTLAAKQAVAELERARPLCPTYAPLLLLQGQLEMNILKEAEAGRAHVELAYRLDPNDPVNCMVAGELEAAAGQWDAAREKFQRAMLLNPGNRWVVAGLYLNRWNRPDLVLDVMAGDYQWLLALADLAGQKRELDLQARARDAAIVLLERNVRDPNVNPNQISSLAELLEVRGRCDEADPYAIRALELHPEWSTVRVLRARCLIKRGAVEAAKEQLRLAIKYDPKWEPARVMLENLEKSK